MLSRIVIEIVGRARDLGGNDVYCRGVCSSTRVCIVRGNMIARFAPWLNTIRMLREPCRLWVVMTRAIRLGAWIADVAIV